MTEKEMLQALCSLKGTSGDETKAAEFCAQLLSPYMKVKIDTLGNVIGCANEGAKVKIMLEAHIDSVGLVIREIDENGFLRFDKVGAADVRTLIGSQVIVFGKREIDAVVCSTPPHLLTKADKEAGVDIKSAAIDIGFCKEKACELVSVGDRAIITAGNADLLSDRFTSSALDDRSSIAAVFLAVSKVAQKLKNVSLCVAFTVQEEVGGSGAKTVAFDCEPDYAISVDVGFGSDLVSDKTQTITLGKGASIGISPVLDRELTNELVSVAKKHGISYQHDVMTPRTGTNADSICVSRGGVKTALLSVPLRNMHTPVEVVDIKDIKLTAELLAAFILEKEEQYNA